ncbi:MAG: tetratricopeptide repeat protein [Planctomycetota bacterium]
MAKRGRGHESVSRPDRGENKTNALPRVPPRTLGGAFVLAVLIGIIYQPAFFGDFVWDDHRMLVDNPMVRLPDGILRMWISTDQPDYWPLSYSTHWLEWRVWGENAAGYRALNITLHLLNTLLVWRLLMVLGVPGAWFAALLFAVHPVNVEAIAWILQRKTLLAHFWSLVSLLAILDYDESKRKSSFGVALASLVLALLSKSSAVIVPPLMLLVLWWRHREIRRRDLLASLPFFAIALVLGSVGVWFQRFRAVAQDNVRADSFLSRFALAGKGVWFYLQKALWPTNLSFVYPRWTADTGAPATYLPSVVLFALLLTFWILRRRGLAACFFALACYVVALFPALGFINIYFMRYSLVADHWQYHALPAAVAFVVACSFRLSSSFPKPWPGVPVAGLVAVALLFGWLAREEAKVYATNESIWRSTLAVNPDAWLAHNELAAILASQGKTAEAIEHFQQSLTLNPDYGDARNNLANAFVTQGRLDDALEELKRAESLDPQSPEIQNSIGRVFGLKGQVKESIPFFKNALVLRPMFSQARRNLALALELTGNHHDAIVHFRLVLDYDPSNEFARFHLARLLLLANDPSLHHPPEAIGHLELLCRSPANASPDHLDLLSAAYGATGRGREAIAMGEIAAKKYAETGNQKNFEAMQLRLKQLREGR